MYGLLWRILPGPWWARALICLVLLAVVAAVLLGWVFPWVQASYFAPIDVTVNGARAVGSPLP